MSQIRVYPTRRAAAHAAAVQFIVASEKAMTTRGRFTVALAGGNTPLEVYRLLAGDEYAPLVEWSYTQIFWGDERAVPLTDPDNNAHMARLALLDHVPIPMNQIHRVPTQLAPEDAAREYEQTLRNYFYERDLDEPRFDFVFLGMGGEGHTASLFPHSPVMFESERWVMATFVEPLKTWRITLTPLALNSASKLVFLVVGEEKAEALREVLSETKQPELYPAQIIDPPQGQVLWIVDKAAASLLDT